MTRKIFLAYQLKLVTRILRVINVKKNGNEKCKVTSQEEMPGNAEHHRTGWPMMGHPSRVGHQLGVQL